MAEANVLLTAWLSWCGGVTFTLMILFALLSGGVFPAVLAKRAPAYAVLFAVLTAALAVVQVGRLSYA